MINIFSAAAAVTIIGTSMMVQPANATLFVEEYTYTDAPYYQGLYEGESLSFGFDLWYDNDSSVRADGVGTNSDLELTQDAVGAFGDWSAASIAVDLFSEDWAWEKTQITLTAYTAGADEVYNLGSFWWNGFEFQSPWFTLSQTDLLFSYDLTQDQLNVFEALGWGDVTITASLTGWCNYNDFGISRVAVSAETSAAPVPEPATMILLGAGLVGLAGYNRKRNGRK